MALNLLELPIFAMRYGRFEGESAPVLARSICMVALLGRKIVP
jgi:hypothetical protein